MIKHLTKPLYPMQRNCNSYPSSSFLIDQLNCLHEALYGVRSKIDEFMRCRATATLEYTFTKQDLDVLRKECNDRGIGTEARVWKIVMMLNRKYPTAHIMPMLVRDGDYFRFTGVSVMMPSITPTPVDTKAAAERAVAVLTDFVATATPANKPVTTQQVRQIAKDYALARIETVVRAAYDKACSEGYHYATVSAVELPVGWMSPDELTGVPLLDGWVKSQGFELTRNSIGDILTLHWR